MEPAFWHERWKLGQIGFHQQRVHPGLQDHAEAFLGSASQRVLVPLCGKSLDLDWLARQGHDVVGVELSEVAVQQFHEEHDRTPEVETHGPYTAYDPSVMSGPPFTIPHEEVEQAYPTAEVVSSDDTVPPPFAARGHEVFEQRLWLAEL